MTASTPSQQRRWYHWPFILLFSPLFWIVLAPFWGLVFLSVIYFSIFPDHHLHEWDCDGTPRQRRRLAQWRSTFRRYGFAGRCVRIFKRGKRRRQMIRQMQMMFQLTPKYSRQ